MGKLVIRRKVSLDFLGDEYKDAYLTFRAIPVKDYGDLVEKLPKDEEKDNGKSVMLILDMLKTYFVDGKFPDGDTLADLTKEDLDDLDTETAIKCFEKVVGKTLDPKVPEQSETLSSTEDQLVSTS